MYKFETMLIPCLCLNSLRHEVVNILRSVGDAEQAMLHQHVLLTANVIKGVI